MSLADQAARGQIEQDLDTNFVVEAAAGTGKTTALISRILAVLAEGRGRMQGLVAVTFTERAAGELKLRLREKLEEERALCSGSRRANLEEALAHLEEAQINTIHGFCGDLVRERPVEARVDPLFKPLSKAAASRLFNQTFEQWFQQTLCEPREGVRRSLRRRGDAVDRLRKAAQKLDENRGFRALWTRPDLDRPAALARLREQLRSFVELVEQTPDPQADNFYRAVQAVRATEHALRREEEVFGSLDPDSLEASLLEIQRFKRRGRRGDIRSADPEGLWQSYKAFNKGLDDFAKEANVDLAASLQHELWEATECYEEIKRRTGRLDFQDLLLGARRLLHSDPYIRGELQSRFTHLFIDEFQDTDPLQAEILLLLAADSPDETDWRQVRVPPGKLFVVADPKQSIYRFRGADVGIYSEVQERLVRQGARTLHLTTSFRAVPNVQKVVNASFEQHMQHDPIGLQADYVKLEPHRPDATHQPSVIALPLTRVETQTQAIAAFIQWLLRDSGWTIAGKPVEARQVCVLLRRFKGVSAAYARALEARSIGHLLVGGQGHEDQGELSGVVAVLCAVEWPDDELSVFATLRGELLGIRDDLLLEYWEQTGHFRPFEIPADLPDHLQEVARGLGLLNTLHARRNERSVAETIADLLAATRAHVNYVLRPSGEQVLANVLRLVELAHAYEAEGGLSFRGFVDQLSDTEWQEAASILEDDSDGVRVMTVHEAKGLEFPVVILADMEAPLTHSKVNSATGPQRDLHAFMIDSWAPRELQALSAREHRIREAEGVRLAYVAATRASDLLVVLTEERGVSPNGWLGPLAAGLTPRSNNPLPGVSWLPEFGPGIPQGRRPGLYRVLDHEVVWWDPVLLQGTPNRPVGLARADLLEEAGEDAGGTHRDWQARKLETLGQAHLPSFRTATASKLEVELPEAALVERIQLSQPRGGAVFGKLVHALFAGVDLAAAPEDVRELASLFARSLGAGPEEVREASERVASALRHPVFDRARGAQDVWREMPLSLVLPDGTLAHGVLDLAFRDKGEWTVVDFKTGLAERQHIRQVAAYVCAVSKATGLPARGMIFGV